MMDDFTGPTWWFQHSLEEGAGDDPRQPDGWGWGGQSSRARQGCENISEDGFKCHFSPLGKPYYFSRTAIGGQKETLHSLFNGPFSPNLFLKRVYVKFWKELKWWYLKHHPAGDSHCGY